MLQTRTQDGFTLVEIMLSLALTAMLLGLLSTAVYIVAADWNRNSDILDESLDEALAVLQIERALHGAFPHSYTDEETLTGEIYFLGEDDYVSWVSAVSPQRSPGLTVWELYSVDDEGVYLTLVPAFSDNPAERLGNTEPLLLLANYSMEINYLYEDLNDSKEWTDEWSGREELALPVAVYMHFIPFDQQQDGKQALEIIAPIKNNQHRRIQPRGTQPGL